jgi:hypothetical protein
MLFPHLGALIPLTDPLAACARRAQSAFTLFAKLMVVLTKAGEGPHAAMLRMRGHMELTEVVASLRDQRPGRAELLLAGAAAAAAALRAVVVLGLLPPFLLRPRHGASPRSFFPARWWPAVTPMACAPCLAFHPLRA